MGDLFQDTLPLPIPIFMDIQICGAGEGVTAEKLEVPMGVVPVPC